MPADYLPFAVAGVVVLVLLTVLLVRRELRRIDVPHHHASAESGHRAAVCEAVIEQTGGEVYDGMSLSDEGAANRFDGHRDTRKPPAGSRPPIATIIESASYPSALPEWPGIDSAVGLVHANGKVEIYRKILRLFRESHGRDFERNLRQALAHDDWRGAARVAHTLKGSARTIGAIELGHLAQRVEEACREQQPARVDQSLDRLLRELSRVSDGLAGVGIDEPSPPSSGG